MPKSRRHFMGVNRSQTWVEDRGAWEQDEELLTDSSESAMAFDDDRQVPYSVLYAEGMTPTLVGYVQPYTGGGKSIDDDGWWMHRKAAAIYYEGANSLTVAKAAGLLASRKVGWVIMGVGIAIALVFLVLIGFNMKLEDQRERDAAAVAAREAGVQEAPTPVGYEVAPGEAGP